MIQYVGVGAAPAIGVWGLAIRLIDWWPPTSAQNSLMRVENSEAIFYRSKKYYFWWIHWWVSNCEREFNRGPKNDQVLFGHRNRKIKFSNVFITRTCHFQVVSNKTQRNGTKENANKWILALSGMSACQQNSLEKDRKEFTPVLPMSAKKWRSLWNLKLWFTESLCFWHFCQIISVYKALLLTELEIAAQDEEIKITWDNVKWGSHNKFSNELYLWDGFKMEGFVKGL